MGHFRGTLKLLILIPQVGLTIGSATALGTALGYWLDGLINTKPALTIVFCLMGIASGLFTGYKFLIFGLNKYGQPEKRDPE